MPAAISVSSSGAQADGAFAPVRRVADADGVPDAGLLAQAVPADDSVNAACTAWPVAPGRNAASVASMASAISVGAVGEPVGAARRG